MLYWICPECGHECSPAVRECPTCTAPPESQPAATAKAAEQPDRNHELLSLAQNFDAQTATLLVPVMQRQASLSANGHETSATNSAVALEDDITQELEL